MTPRRRARLVVKIRQLLWMALVLVFVSLICRRLLAAMAFIEAESAAIRDIGPYVVLSVQRLIMDWPFETLLFLALIAGLGWLFQAGNPLGGAGKNPRDEGAELRA